ncbi:MAG TPA: hypothetical protein VHB01_08475 [Nitrosospira sp.]|nr:hypothetical protein [Nitrosospira sp.]
MKFARIELLNGSGSRRSGLRKCVMAGGGGKKNGSDFGEALSKVELLGEGG